MKVMAFHDLASNIGRALDGGVPPGAVGGATTDAGIIAPKAKLFITRICDAADGVARGIGVRSSCALAHHTVGSGCVCSRCSLLLRVGPGNYCSPRSEMALKAGIKVSECV
jgi:hypothetical protein